MNTTEYNGAGIYRISFGNSGKCYIGQSMNVHRRLQWNFQSSQASYDEEWRAMDGSETPEISPARRAYNFALAILNDWIEQEEQK